MPTAVFINFFLCNKWPPNLSGSQAQFLVYRLAVDMALLCSLGFNCAWLQHLYCMQVHLIHVSFWNSGWVLEFKRIKKKYVMLLKPLFRIGTLLLLPIYCWLKKSYFWFKRNLNYDLKEIIKQPQISGCGNIIQLSFGRPSRRVWTYIHIIKKRQSGPIMNTALVYFFSLIMLIKLLD